MPNDTLDCERVQIGFEPLKVAGRIGEKRLAVTDQGMRSEAVRIPLQLRADEFVSSVSKRGVHSFTMPAIIAPLTSVRR